MAEIDNAKVPSKAVLNKTLKKKSLILDDGNVYKIQKVRHRKILSCIPCHQRKIRCSRGVVCDHCRRNDLSCQYFINDKLSTSKHKNDSAGDGLASCGQPGHPPSPCEDRSGKAKTINVSSVSNEKRSIFISVGVRENQSINHESPSSVDLTHDIDNTLEAPSTESQIPPQYPNQLYSDSQTIQSSKSCGESEKLSTPWASCEDIGRAEKYGSDSTPQTDNSTSELQAQDSEAPVSPFTQSNGGSPTTSQQMHPSPNHQLVMNIDDDVVSAEDNDYKLNARVISLLEGILLALPSHERSVILLEIFVSSINPLLPVIDLKNFKEDFYTFWKADLHLLCNAKLLYRKDKAVGGFQTIDKLFEFLWIYFAMLFSSAKAESEAQGSFERTHAWETDKYSSSFAAISEFMITNAGKLSTISFQVNVLVLCFTDLSTNKSLLDVAKLIRLAQYYKLNYDPVVHGSYKSQSLIQLKKIVWWQIFALDNTVSGYHRLPSTIRLNEFDTSLPVENSAEPLPAFQSLSSTAMHFSNYATCFLNSKFRYHFLQNELNAASNGLNASMNIQDINNLKFKINDLYIFCYSSIISLQNSEKSVQDQIIASSTSSTSANHIYQQLRFLSYAKYFLNCLADKVLIRLQLRILETPDSVMSQLRQNYDKFYNEKDWRSVGISGRYDENDRNDLQVRLKFMKANLNLTLNEKLTSYSYNDLSSNLLPSLLHMLSQFNNIYEYEDPTTKKGLETFNWELRNYLPTEEVALLISILVVNLKLNKGNQIEDTNMKIYILDTTIRYLRYHWQDKFHGSNNVLSILTSVWTMVKLCFHLSPQKRYYRVPEPSLSPTVHSSVAAPSSNINLMNVHESHHMQEIQQQYTTTSCAEIAPRSMRSNVSNMMPYNVQFGNYASPFSPAATVPTTHKSFNLNEAEKAEMETLRKEIEVGLNSIGEEEDEFSTNIKKRLSSVFALILE